MKSILKSKYAIASCAIIVALLAGTTALAFQNNKFFSIGQRINQVANVNDSTAVAVVGDKNITKKTFDTYKALYSASDNMPTDAVLLDKLIEREVIYQQALKDNISVSEEEVDKALQDQKDIVAKDSDANEQFKNLIQGKNISEEEYWNTMKESLRKDLIRGKYINNLKSEFKTQNPNIQDSESQSKYKEYYNDKINSLKSTMKIEKFIN